MLKQHKEEFNLEEILALVNSYKKQFQEMQYSDIYRKKKQEQELPEFHPTYKFEVELMDANRVHAEKGFFPEKLFKERSPNETDKEYNYRKANYHQITLPVFMDFVSTISRALHDTNWSIEYTKDDERYLESNLTFQQYVETEIDNFGSVEEFIKSFLITYKLIDANGVLAVKPEHIPLTENEEGVVSIDGERLIEPEPFYYSSKQIISYLENVHALIYTGEKSMVEYGGVKKQMGIVLEFYDTKRIWRVVQVGKYIDFTFAVELFFEHNWGNLPVRKLKGVPLLKEGELIYQSPFAFAVDNLDIALLNSSNLQIATSRCAFPTPVMYGSVCDFEDENHNRCLDGKINTEGVFKDCPKCNGSGLRSRLSPMGTILLKPPTREDDGDATMKQNPLEYVSPSPDILKFLEESIDKHESKARKILHLRDSDTQVQFNADTATSSNNDLKSTYSFIKPISDQIFSLYEFTLNAIGWMRYGEFFKPPVVHYPMTFDFKTENDYLIEINNAVKVGLPPFALHRILFNYLNTIFFTEKQSMQALTLIVNADRLFGLTRDEITIKLSRGLIAGWEDILHQSAFTFIDDLVRANEKFFEQDLQTQIDALKNKAKEKEAELKGNTPAATAAASILNAA